MAFEYKRSRYAFKSRIDVALKVRDRALSDFVQNYCTANEMPDREMADAFYRAQQALDELDEMFKQSYEDEPEVPSIDDACRLLMEEIKRSPDGLGPTEIEAVLSPLGIGSLGSSNVVLEMWEKGQITLNSERRYVVSSNYFKTIEGKDG